MSIGPKIKEIEQIKTRNISIQEKIELIRKVHFSDMEAKCFSCKHRQQQSKKILEQTKGFEIHKLEQLLLGNTNE